MTLKGIHAGLTLIRKLIFHSLIVSSVEREIQGYVSTENNKESMVGFITRTVCHDDNVLLSSNKFDSGRIDGQITELKEY
jgi:hypothetical protein